MNISADFPPGFFPQVVGHTSVAADIDATTPTGVDHVFYTCVATGVYQFSGTMAATIPGNFSAISLLTFPDGSTQQMSVDMFSPFHELQTFSFALFMLEGQTVLFRVLPNSMTGKANAYMSVIRLS